MKEVPISGVPAVPDPKAPIPRQIRYIIGNEGCERFSFYGMRNILTVFLVTSLLMYLPEADRASAAKDVFHTFVVGVYFFPLLGGWLADRFFGKYNTIFWLSLVYCVGQLCLALFVTNRLGFYVGLSLIALGSGGIKPCVASFVGDQFDQTNKHRAKVVFDAFYWIINFGSLFASFLMPIFLRSLGPAIAFGIPGGLMFLATFVLRVLVLFAIVTPFWSLFDQKASTWVLQADAMTKPSWFQSSQMQALNPALVMLLIPFNNLVLYPALRRRGYEPTALRRMTAGIAFAGVSWIIVGVMQLVLDGGHAFTIAWQMLPYAFLTLGEV